MPDSQPQLRSRNWFSLLIPLGAYLALILVVQPWGNYPLNDDWIFARITKRFADTGKFVLDPDSEPSLIGQTLIATPVIRLLGFSHTSLRILTLVFGALILYLLWRLLGFAEVPPAVKTLTLLTIALNPLFASMSMSFMTEIYGYAFAMAAAVVWFWGRQRAEARAALELASKAGPPSKKKDRRQPGESPRIEAPLISWPAAIGTALAAGASFWIRQYCVLIYPAILGATLLRCALNGEWTRLKRSAAQMMASCAVVSFVVARYFPWAKSVARPKAAFFSYLGGVWSSSATEWFQALSREPGIVLTYMTAFFLPLLALSRMGRHRRSHLLAMGAALVAVGLVAVAAIQGVVSKVPGTADIYHSIFPFSGNMIYNTGLGPLTLPDVFLMGLPKYPKWPPGTWTFLQWVFLAANALWAPAALDLLRTLRKKENGHRSELFSFGWLFAVGTFAGIVLVRKVQVLDRYYLPTILGLALVAGIAVSFLWRAISWRTGAIFAVVLAGLGFFTAAGLHDYFRWNDARADMYNRLLAQGVFPVNIDAGYEINGWFVYGTPAELSHCIGKCACASRFYCLDDSYRIGMNLFGNYDLIDLRPIDYWLADGPPVILSRRR
jgi:hypothetical protein